MEHFNPERLLQIVLELWGAFEFPEHVTVGSPVYGDVELPCVRIY